MKRPLAVLALIAIILVGFLLAPHDASKPTEVKQTPKPVVVQAPKPIPLTTTTAVEAKVNEYRASQGLSTLADNQILDQAALTRAEELCADNVFNHNADWAILRQYYAYSSAGENLYYGGLRADQENDVITSWVASPEHLANIVGSYTQFGIGVKSCPGYQGAADAVIVTNYFGVPE